MAECSRGPGRMFHLSRSLRSGWMGLFVLMLIVDDPVYVSAFFNFAPTVTKALGGSNGADTGTTSLPTSLPPTTASTTTQKLTLQDVVNRDGVEPLPNPEAQRNFPPSSFSREESRLDTVKREYPASIRFRFAFSSLEHSGEWQVLIWTGLRLPCETFPQTCQAFIFCPAENKWVKNFLNLETSIVERIRNEPI